MNNLNTVLIEGNLTRDPKMMSYSKNFELCRFSIANNRYYLKKDGTWNTDTSYFLIEVFGQAANACIKYLKKGRGVRIVGRLKLNQWKIQGMPHELVTIIAEHIEFQPEKQKPKKNVDDSSNNAVENPPIPDMTEEEFECAAECTTEIPNSSSESNEFNEKKEQEEEDEEDEEEDIPTF